MSLEKLPKEKDLDHHQQNLDPENPGSLRFFCRSCSSTLSHLFRLRCLLVVVLGLAVLISAIFWLFLPLSISEFEASDQVKLRASVQACFRLQKPSSKVISHKGRLEHDIFRGIGLKNTKVTVLSVHQSGSSNWTDVEFAVLPDPNDYTISQDSLNSLRSSFVKLFVQRLDLNLSKSQFGQPSSFQVLKFPKGITVDPLGTKAESGVLEIMFNFILDNSISEIEDRLIQLKDQLEFVLRLEPYESIHVELTNEEGCTISSPIIVQVSVTSSMETHLQQRLDHLSQMIQTSSANNLGLDYSVFGEVKSITFSTYLDDKTPLHSPSKLAPTPSSS